MLIQIHLSILIKFLNKEFNYIVEKIICTILSLYFGIEHKYALLYFVELTHKERIIEYVLFVNKNTYEHLESIKTSRKTLFIFINILFFKKFYLFYLWLCWVFVSVRGLSLVVASGGHSSSWCAGLSLSWPLLSQSTGSRCAGSVIVAHGLSCSAACGIFPDQGSNPCPLHWQADSQPLRHQGSPIIYF